MTRLKISNPQMYGKVVIIPVFGEVQITQEGFIEAEDKELAIKVANMNIGYELVEETKSEESSEERKEMENMKVVDLQELAKPFPKEEWISKKKSELIDYLLSKISTKVEE